MHSCLPTDPNFFPSLLVLRTAGKARKLDFTIRVIQSLWGCLDFPEEDILSSNAPQLFLPAMVCSQGYVYVLGVQGECPLIPVCPLATSLTLVILAALFLSLEPCLLAESTGANLGRSRSAAMCPLPLLGMVSLAYPPYGLHVLIPMALGPHPGGTW